MKYLTLLALFASSTSAFPDFDSFHAHCQVMVDVEKDCATALKDLSEYVKSGRDEASPAGKYALFQEDSTMVWATRLTANGKYTDDVQWQKLDDGSATKCTIVGKSRSQSLSYYDYNVNFCNIYNPLRGTGFDGDITSSTKVSNCNFPASSASTCDRY